MPRGHIIRPQSLRLALAEITRSKWVEIERIFLLFEAHLRAQEGMDTSRHHVKRSKFVSVGNMMKLLRIVGV